MSESDSAVTNNKAESSSTSILNAVVAVPDKKMTQIQNDQNHDEGSSIVTVVNDSAVLNPMSMFGPGSKNNIRKDYLSRLGIGGPGGPRPGPPPASQQRPLSSGPSPVTSTVQQQSQISQSGPGQNNQNQSDSDQTQQPQTATQASGQQQTQSARQRSGSGQNLINPTNFNQGLGPSLSSSENGTNMPKPNPSNATPVGGRMPQNQGQNQVLQSQTQTTSTISTINAPGVQQVPQPSTINAPGVQLVTQQSPNESDLIEDQMNNYDNDLVTEIEDLNSDFILNYLDQRAQDDFRVSFLRKLSYQKVWVPSSQRPPQHQTVVIFDWDDTLLCTSYLNLRLPTPEIPVHVQKQLVLLEKVGCQLLELALKLGQTFIITNAMRGWVEYSAAKYVPRLLPILQKITVISARGNYEHLHPGNYGQWKIEAFLEVQRQLNSQIITNLISLGDSNMEMDAVHVSYDSNMEMDAAAVHVMGKEFSQALIKTIKFRESPTPEELVKQLELVAQKFEKIILNARNLKIGLERKWNGDKSRQTGGQAGGQQQQQGGSPQSGSSSGGRQQSSSQRRADVANDQMNKQSQQGSTVQHSSLGNTALHQRMLEEQAAKSKTSSSSDATNSTNQNLQSQSQNQQYSSTIPHPGSQTQSLTQNSPNQNQSQSHTDQDIPVHQLGQTRPESINNDSKKSQSDEPPGGYPDEVPAACLPPPGGFNKDLPPLTSPKEFYDPEQLVNKRN